MRSTTTPESTRLEELTKENLFLEKSLDLLSRSIDKPTWFKNKTTEVLEFFHFNYDHCSTPEIKAASRITILKILQESMVFLNLALEGRYEKISQIISFLKSIDCSTSQIQALMSSRTKDGIDITNTTFTTNLIYTRHGPIVQKTPRGIKEFIELTHWIYAGYLDERRLSKLNKYDPSYVIDQKERFFQALQAIDSFDYLWKAVIEVESDLGKIFNDRHSSYLSVADLLKAPRYQATLLTKIRELSLTPKQRESASRFKESLIKHIKGLDRTEAREIVSEALTIGTPLNHLFSFERQTGIGSHFFGAETTSIRSLRIYKAELDLSVDNSEGIELPVIRRQSS